MAAAAVHQEGLTMKSKLGAALVAVSVVLTVATAQANPANFIGLQEAGVNGGAITIYTGPPTVRVSPTLRLRSRSLTPPSFPPPSQVPDCPA